MRCNEFSQLSLLLLKVRFWHSETLSGLGIKLQESSTHCHLAMVSAVKRLIRSFHGGVNAPQLTKFALRRPHCVEVEFVDGHVFNLSSEFLRVYSPAADSKTRFIGVEKVIFGRRHVGIMSAEPIGNYGVRLLFDDLHKTGIYTWDYFYHLGSNKFSLMRNYIKTLKKYGLSRDPRSK
ncbi:hypothetical protein Dimus_029145 [Dionaea muscipula]